MLENAATPPAVLLKSATRAEWASIAVDDLDATLADHAHCEKKAAASAIALINAYPGDVALVNALSPLVNEEMDHFREIYGVLQSRRQTLSRDMGDPYVQHLMELVRSPGDERKLDRLLVAALIEARSCERFGLLRDELDKRGDREMAQRFKRLEHSEAGHATLFLKLARDEFGEEPTNARFEELAHAEARIVATLPLLPRIH